MDTAIRFKRAWRTGAVLLLLIIVVHSGQQFPSMVEYDIDNFIKEVMKCNNIPGLTIAVVQGGKSMLRGYGVPDFRSNAKVDEKTLFCIGSISKSFTTTVLGKALQDSKRWNWDTPVSEIIGDGFKLSDEYRTKYITVRDILAHKTGVPDYEGAYTTGYTVERETLAWRLQYMNATHPPNTKFMYNNHMYMLAGYVAERITGRTWEELVQDEIFNNLEMYSSAFVRDLGEGPNVAKAFALTPDKKLVELPQKLNSMVYPLGPAGSICTNSVDMAKYLRFELNNGKMPCGKQLLNEEIFNEIHAPQMPMPPIFILNVLKPPLFPASFNAYAYAFGWMISTYRGYHLLMHAGGISGFISDLWLIPDQQIGIFTSYNGPTATLAPRLIHQYITDRLLGLKPWLNGTSACEFPIPWLRPAMNKNKKDDAKEEKERDVKIATRAHLLRQYVGTYGHPAFGEISIRLNKTDGLLHLYVGRWGHAKLEETSVLGKFVMKFVDVLQYYTTKAYPIRFSSSKGKRIDRLYAPYIDETSPPIFVRGLKVTSQSRYSQDSRTRYRFW